MRLPAKLPGLGFKVEVMKRGVNFEAVWNGSFNATDWRKRTRRVDLVEPLLDLKFARWVIENPKAKLDVMHRAIPRVSRLLTGKRQVNLKQLIRLAHHFGLVGVVGDEQEAAALLCDDVPLQEFERRLVQSGWRPAGFEQPPYASRSLLLAEFERVSRLKRTGLSIRTESLDKSTRLDGWRGAILPGTLSLDDDLFEGALGDRVKFRLEMQIPAGLMLFEIRPCYGKGQRYEVACLAPSVMAPDTTVKPSRGIVLIPPPRPGDRPDFFVLDHPLGRHDVVAVLSSPAIKVPWSVPADSLYEPSASELRALLRAVDEARQTGEHKVEIRHFAYRIVPGGST